MLTARIAPIHGYTLLSAWLDTSALRGTPRKQLGTLLFEEIHQERTLPGGIGTDIYSWCHKYPESVKVVLVYQPLLSKSQQTSQSRNMNDNTSPAENNVRKLRLNGGSIYIYIPR